MLLPETMLESRGNYSSPPILMLCQEPTEIERSDEEAIHAVYRGNLINRFKSFLGLDLQDGQEAIICLLEIFGQGGRWLEPFHGERGSESSITLRRELGGSHDISGFLGGLNQGYHDLFGIVSIRSESRLRYGKCGGVKEVEAYAVSTAVKSTYAGKIQSVNSPR